LQVNGIIAKIIKINPKISNVNSIKVKLENSINLIFKACMKLKLKLTRLRERTNK